ncbi:LysR family transcriptional regulator [Cereibacter sp. SYSU M97828]|nr:LysR family transcriptional regulator [Cereibacter flavus]
MKLNQLRLIAAIAEHGQLQVAADMLAISQPAASRMLAEVERVVGGALFLRHPKGMTMTLLGRVLARRAAAMTVGMQDMARELQLLRQGKGGVVRVGSVTGPGVGYLVPAIRQLKGASPDVEVMVDIAPSTQLLRGLVAGDYDFVIGRLLPDSDRADFSVEPAGHEVVRFLVRRDHPLVSVPALPLAELRNYDWIIQDRGTPIREVVDARIGGAEPRGLITTTSLLLMVALLLQSNAIAPMAQEVTDLMTAAPIGGFAALDLAEEIVVPPYFIIETRGRQLSPAAQRLKALLQSELHQR